MAFATIIFENPHSGGIKEAPLGFSWTTFFFGFFPALFRGDWKWAIIQLILVFITFGLSWLVFIFIYNNLYIKDLIGVGYKAKSISNGNMDSASSRIGMKVPMLNEQ